MKLQFVKTVDRIRYLIGVATLITALAGGVFLFNLLGDEDKSQYFRVHLEFRNVEGLLPGADVKYRGVQVGSVRQVTLRDDGKKGIATIVLNPGKDTLARTNSRFWIVTPRFGGITAGASGLDTLVRNAYMTFYTPDPWGVQLANGSSALGLETPFVDPTESSLPPAVRGDLMMTLLVPENYGLVVGSAVMYRGVQTGDIRGVELAKDGNHIRLAIRIERAHRGTVTDKTRFWVARPRLSGALLRGIDLQDVSALLTPFVSYHTEPSAGLPVPDAYTVAAETTRPSFEIAKVDLATQPSATQSLQAPVGDGLLQLVRVIYEAEEEDWLSPNDLIRREGTGVLWEDSDGRLLVLTARTLCDANHFDRDSLGGAPDIISEGISVVLGDGSVLRALRTWVAGDGEDLALLVIDVELAAREGIPTTAASLFEFGGAAIGTADVDLRAMDNQRRVVEVSRSNTGDPTLVGHRGAVALSDGSVIGLLVQSVEDPSAAAIVSVDVVPEVLRPAQ